MPEYLPGIYTGFRDDYPDVAQALDALGAATGAAGPLEERTQRLVKLGIAIGGLAEGAVRSNVRRALEIGISAEELRHVALLAVTTGLLSDGDRRALMDGGGIAGRGLRVPSSSPAAWGSASIGVRLKAGLYPTQEGGWVA